MKKPKTTEKKSETRAGSLKILTKLTGLWTDSSRKKERRIKSTELERKKERLQQTRHKCKGL